MSWKGNETFSLSSAISKELTYSKAGFTIVSLWQTANWSESTLTMESSIEIRHFESFWALFVVYFLSICNWRNSGLWRNCFLSAGMEKGINIAKIIEVIATFRAKF